MKKILFLGPIPPEVGGHSAGGIATHNWELSYECAKRDYDVYIYSGQRNTEERINEVTLLANVSKLKQIMNCELSLNVKVIYRKSILRPLVNNIRPDIIHIHSLKNSFIDALDEKITDKRKIIVTDHAFWNTDRSISKIQCRIEKADRIIAISDQFFKKIKTYNVNVDRKKVVKIYHPIETNLYTNLDVNRKENKIFYSCYSAPVRKGLLEFLNMIKSFNLDKYEFSITLNDRGIKIFKSIFNKKPSNITIHHGLSFIECLKEYASSKLFLMPSYSEGFAMVFREALLAGTPILGYKPNVDEIKENYSTYIGESYDITNESEKDLYFKIENMMNTKFDHKKIIEETKLAFGWENQFDKYNDIYRY